MVKRFNVYDLDEPKGVSKFDSVLPPPAKIADGVEITDEEFGCNRHQRSRELTDLLDGTDQFITSKQMTDVANRYLTIRGYSGMDRYNARRKVVAKMGRIAKKEGNRFHNSKTLFRYLKEQCREDSKTKT